MRRANNRPVIIGSSQVPGIVLATKLKHLHAVAGPPSAADNRLGRFQAIVFGHSLAIAVVVAPEVVVVNLLFVCCPVLWWNYLGS
jgi:hypothetical protein